METNTQPETATSTKSELIEPLEDFPDYGDLLLMDDFIESCKMGFFTDYDGFGCYATETKVSKFRVTPSEVKNIGVNKRWSHVLWFNR